jgi:hypothetical protein
MQSKLGENSAKSPPVLIETNSSTCFPFAQVVQVASSLDIPIPLLHFGNFHLVSN